jgi:hypothetical protein
MLLESLLVCHHDSLPSLIPLPPVWCITTLDEIAIGQQDRVTGFVRLQASGVPVKHIYTRIGGCHIATGHDGAHMVDLLCHDVGAVQTVGYAPEPFCLTLQHIFKNVLHSSIQ